MKMGNALKIFYQTKQTLTSLKTAFVRLITPLRKMEILIYQISQHLSCSLDPLIVFVAVKFKWVVIMESV